MISGMRDEARRPVGVSARPLSRGWRRGNATMYPSWEQVEQAAYERFERGVGCMGTTRRTGWGRSATSLWSELHGAGATQAEWIAHDAAGGAGAAMPILRAVGRGSELQRGDTPLVPESFTACDVFTPE